MKLVRFHPPLSTDPPLSLGDPIMRDSSAVHVEAKLGPSEMICAECWHLMLPWMEFTPKSAPDRGLSRWLCFVCWRAVLVTWSEAGPQTEGADAR